MTYEPWNEDSFLIRFELILELEEDPEFSKPVSFNLGQVFPGDYTFTEVTLAANQRIEELDRLQFQTEGATASAEESVKQKASLTDDLVLTLKPMQIATIIVSPRQSESTSAPTTSTRESDSNPSTTQQTTTAFGVRSQTISQIFPFIVILTVLKQFL